MTYSINKLVRWSPEEIATASKLFEKGVRPGDIADTINALYHSGRTGAAVQRQMHVLGFRYASRIEPDEMEAADIAAIRQRQEAGRNGYLARARNLEASEREEDEERRPWHPLRDNVRLLAMLNQ